MTFTIPWLAVILATAADFLFGAVWYSFFGTTWLAAIGKRKDELNAKDPTPYLTAMIASFLHAIATAFVIDLVMPHTATRILTAFLTGLLLGGAVCASALARHYAFAGRAWQLFLIDAGHDVIGFLLLSVVIVLLR
jgi:hypothetical protein